MKAGDIRKEYHSRQQAHPKTSRGFQHNHTTIRHTAKNLHSFLNIVGGEELCSPIGRKTRTYLLHTHRETHEHIGGNSP